jgi:hypothetical protein
MCFSQRRIDREVSSRLCASRQDRGAREAGWVDLRSNPEILLLCLLNLGAHQKEG